MGEKLLFLLSLEENDKATAADVLLPGIKVFLEEILGKECLSYDAQSFRHSYISLLNCCPQETRQTLRQRIQNVSKQQHIPSATVKHETRNKSSKLGHVREKKLINIRQFKVNQKKFLSRKMSDATVVSTTDDEDQTMGDEHFVEISKSEKDLLSSEFSTINNKDTIINGSYLFSKENDGLRRRWCVLEDGILKCYKRQSQTPVYEVKLKDGNYSAIQGRLGNMYAIRLSGTTGSYLFASANSEICATWLVAFSQTGVQLQDDILRQVTINKQNNNNKVSWLFPPPGKCSEDLFRSDLLEALELIERSRSPHILPKRSSYSFKELDVLKKLKASLVAKRSESKLNRRKTWSAGSFPNIAIIERFRNPISVSEGDGLASEKTKTRDDAPNGPDQTLPEILTSSGVVKVDKQDDDDDDLGTSVETMDPLSPTEDEPSFVKSMPEGLNEQPDPTCSPIPRQSIVAQSVPDLLLLPPSSSETSTKQESKTFKPSVSLTRVMSSKASSMKNAIITGLRRKGRRSAGRVVVDRDLAEIHGSLYRKKGGAWKQRWCAVMKATLYAFRDSSFENEDFRCDLHKLIALRSGDVPGRANTFKIVRRKGEEITLSAGSNEELERWMSVLQRTMSKQNLSPAVDSRSSSLTPSYVSADTYQDSSAPEDTLTDPEKSESNYCETTDKDSSDETPSASFKIKPRGISERGYMYHLVREDTWEHCWVEVIFGVLSVYNSERKETVLQRDRIALCDVQGDEVDGERLYSFSLKRPNRPAIYLEVDNENDFQKWLKCFNSWVPKERTKGIEDDADTDSVRTSDSNCIPKATANLLEATPNTSDSDSCYLEPTEMNRDDGERPIRRVMTNVFQQLTPPKVRRRYTSSAGMIEVSKTAAVKSSFLYFRANSGLWVKYWCLLESSVIYCFNSPEEAKSSFLVDVAGSDIKRTSHKDKNYTFEVFSCVTDKHFEFAGETTYIMYSWMRVLKIHAGLINKKETTSENVEITHTDSTSCSPVKQEPGIDCLDGQEDRVIVNGETAVEKDQGRNITSGISNSSLVSKPVTSPKRNKGKITSLDQVLKLLHEKSLEQELQNKEQGSSDRAKLKWKHAMLVALRKTRTPGESSKRSGSESGSVVAAPELDEKTVKVKSNEISQKYDHWLEDERLKMLRRETLLKKRRNSLILRKDVLERKLGKSQEASGKAPTKKRHSKIDGKSETGQLSKGDADEVRKQLVGIKKELDDIHSNIHTNLEEQKRTGLELNEQKRKELHELRLTVERSPQNSKSNLPEHCSLSHRRQASDTSLSVVKSPPEYIRKLSVPEGERLKTVLSTPVQQDLRKAMSFSASPRLTTTRSSPLLRTKTFDNTLTRPVVRTRSSQETMSLALSQIEDFEQFVQDF